MTDMSYRLRQSAKLWQCVVVAAMGIWLFCWLFHTRYALLDDALIHLRYATFLHRDHFITFDGLHRSFGASSLLYVSLLAVLRGLTTNPLLPKLVSDVGYLALIGVICAAIVNAKQRLLTQLLLAELLLCLLSPMGIRWLTDGMETSITNLLIVGLALVVNLEQKRDSQTILRYLLLTALGAALVFLRIELALVIAICSLSIVCTKWGADKSLIAAVVEASPLSAGALMALLSIRMMMGSLLPDTALAKSGLPSLLPLLDTVHMLGSSLLLGAGCCLCWAQSAFSAYRRANRMHGRQAVSSLLALLLVNCVIFLVVALSCLRGQSIQGVRYVIWPFIFGIVMNAMWLAGSESAVSEEFSSAHAIRRLFVAFCILYLCVLPIDWRWANRAMQGRAQTFLAMRSANLGQVFARQPIIAADVGFISYFSEGDTCDLDGLVNGRAAAGMTPSQRVANCAQKSPVMLFLNDAQIRSVQPVMELDRWRICGTFNFANVRSNDLHYLIVPEKDAAYVCERMGAATTSVATVLQRAN